MTTTTLRFPFAWILPSVWIRRLLSGEAAPLRAQGGAGDAAALRREEEAEWVRAARHGSHDAFRRLVDRYGDQAYETALRIVGRREEAEEAAQDAFLRAWRALPGFREEARFSTWLYRIVTRRALDAARGLRTRSEREAPVEPEVIEAHAAPGGPAPEASLRRLRSLLGGLEPVPRAVVTLFYLRDLPVREIAEILEMPEGTVKTHLHRSRAELRRSWNRAALREDS